MLQRGIKQMDENLEKVKERNEKNKAFRKRLKNLYKVMYGLMAFMFVTIVILTIESPPRTVMIPALYVECVLFVVWLLCCIIGGLRIRCPHCNAYIGRSDPWNIRKCPYCGESLEILEYYGNKKL